jgi:hypothetical protein
MQNAKSKPMTQDPHIEPPASSISNLVLYKLYKLYKLFNLIHNFQRYV